MREGWEYKKLGDCFPFIKNGANIKQDKNADGYPITRIETLSGGIFNRDRLGYANIYDLSKYSEYILKSRDLLMSHINSKTYIGRTVEYVAEGDEAIIHGMNLLRLKSNCDIIDSTYFVYYTNCHEFKASVAKIRKDAVNQSSFAISDLKSIPIPVPPLPEQQRIVSELDLLSSLIDKQKAQLKELDKLAQSIFYDMFGDPVENEKGWEVKKLGKVCSLKAGKAIKADELSDGNQYPCYGGNGIRGYINKCSHTQSAPIIGRQGAYCGTVNFAEAPFYATEHAVVVKTLHELDIKWLYYTLIHLKLSRFAKGQAQPGIAVGDLTENVNVPLPPLPLQQLFAEKIQAIESQKASITQSIAETQKLFDYTMDKYFG